ncbi:hypothetical protein RND81_10G077600 [Saponaria officinalis]|uniref:HMA domain-containing protein n=1 Tax=Saponaria officinalis TaxID=3572 RepID=A0AAW1HZW2_SAPOF
MKQKIVIKVFMRCEKCRKEVMKIAATADGVISVTLQGNDKDQVVVVGNEVDSAGLCTALRKKAGNATLLSVEEVKDPPKPEEKKKEETKKEEPKKPEDKKQENNNKSQDDNKKPSSTGCPCPGMYYHPPCQPPQYNHCQNPQFLMCTTLPLDDNPPPCSIM